MLTADVEDTAQLRWWLLAFGDQVEVLKPQELRRNMQETCQNMVGIYGDG